MSGIAVVFKSWRDEGVVPNNSYAVTRHANDYIEPLRNQLDEWYDELRAFEAEDDPDYGEDTAELRGKCFALAWAIACFYKPDEPDLSEVRQATHARWLERQEG